ncbi:MAG: flagellar protein FlgN [Planctomycetota bacterium]
MTGTDHGTRLWAELPGVLDRMIGAHEAWLAALELHKVAIASADSAGIDAAVRAEHTHAEAVQTLEAERRALMGSPARPITGQREMTVTELANTRPEPERGELLDRARSLRALIERVRREQSIVREASSSVLSHMRGLMHQLSSRLSHAGTYGSGGKVAAGPVVVSGLDIRQ